MSTVRDQKKKKNPQKKKKKKKDTIKKGFNKG